MTIKIQWFVTWPMAQTEGLVLQRYLQECYYVVVEMNIIKVALLHFCRRTTVQSDSVSVSSQAGDSSSLVDSTKHIVSQPERTTGTAQSSVPVERQEEKARPELLWQSVPCSCGSRRK